MKLTIKKSKRPENKEISIEALPVNIYCFETIIYVHDINKLKTVYEAKFCGTCIDVIIDQFLILLITSKYVLS